ncbi:hypothetical protein RHMOL_Rhmol01G0196200 [Rhododendron molle]|nr:hypothetical protein RHMOL_Rhmol01G0196200 [Rhododendron molle]
MAPKIAQPYLKILIDNSISGGIAPNRFVRNGGRFLKLGELVLAANGSISRVPIVNSWRRIKAIFGTIALVEAKNQSYIDSISSFLSRFRIYRPFRQALQISRIGSEKCFNLPSYSCVQEGSDHSLRLAEYVAAEIALNTLANKGPSKALTSKVLVDWAHSWLQGVEKVNSAN